MTLETNAFTTYSAVGNAEDVSDIIYNVDPHETPFITMAEQVTATAVNHEWQTDTLDTPVDNNAHLEGDEYSAASTTATARKGNICQISKKKPRVTGTQRAVKSYGRADELDYQVMKKGKALKNDMEMSLLANNTKASGDATTARELGGAEAWLETNTNRGAGGADGGSGTAATDGTARTFTEALLKDVLQQCWTNGGNPDAMLLGGFNKQIFSTFTGNATRFDKSEDKKIYAGVEVYVSDFGQLEVIPCRHVRSRSALVLQKNMWAIAYLRPIHTIDIAKTGDSDAKELIAEYTLEARNEKSSGIIADLAIN